MWRLPVMTDKQAADCEDEVHLVGINTHPPSLSFAFAAINHNYTENIDGSTGMLPRGERFRRALHQRAH